MKMNELARHAPWLTTVVGSSVPAALSWARQREKCRLNRLRSSAEGPAARRSCRPRDRPGASRTAKHSWLNRTEPSFVYRPGLLLTRGLRLRLPRDLDYRFGP